MPINKRVDVNSTIPTASQPRQIIVGDIHGELKGLQEILLHARMINKRKDWIGECDVLIQIGDVIDRGPKSRESLYLLRKLQSEAEDVGGKVIRLCGNHELMLLQGHYYYAEYSNPEQLAHELAREVLEGKITASYTDGIRLYTHAGVRSSVRKTLIEEILREQPTLQPDKIDLFMLSGHINDQFARFLGLGDLETHPIFHVDRKRGGSYRDGGIFWGDYSLIASSDEAWNVPQVFGHTPTRKNGVAHEHDFKLVDVDAGMCRVYGGYRVYLEITSSGTLIERHKNRGEWIAAVLGEEN